MIYILLRRVSRKPAKETFSAVEIFAAEIGQLAESLINELVQSIQPKKVGMFWKSFLKLLKALMDGRCCAGKKFQIKEEKPQEHHFASA